MNHIVLVHPAIPQNTGNIMRTCVATNTALHIIKPMSFELDDKKMKRAGLDYIKDLDLHVYESYEEFKAKNPGEYHFFTRYSKLCYTDQDYSDSSKEHYLFFGHEHDGIPKENLKEKICNYDIVVVSIPLTKDTYHLFNDDMFSAMKDGSVFINIARGGIQCEDALYNALKSGKLMAAAVDVFEKEPLDPESPLWDLENFFYSTHNSFCGDKNDETTAKIVLDNLKAFIEGRKINDLV